MKPLSEEELSKSAWEDFLNCQEVDDDAINAYIYGYKQGYAKCVEQMYGDFNELISACNVAMEQSSIQWAEINKESKEVFDNITERLDDIEGAEKVKQYLFDKAFDEVVKLAKEKEASDVVQERLS